MLQQLILYFVSRTKGHITKTQLVKFLYLADLYAVKWTGKQLTRLDWRYYHFGPWSQEIDEAIGGMDSLIFPQEEGDTTLIRIHDESILSMDLGLSEGLELMLENIRREWAGSGSEKFRELLSYVYSTAPMTEAQSKYDRQENAPLDLQLERQKLLEELGV